MGSRRFLATYRMANYNYSFDWLEDEDDVQDWLNRYKDEYTELEIIELNINRILFQDGEYCGDWHKDEK